MQAQIKLKQIKHHLQVLSLTFTTHALGIIINFSFQIITENR